MSLGVPLKAGGGSFRFSGTRSPAAEVGLSLGVSAGCDKEVKTAKVKRRVEKSSNHFSKGPLDFMFVIRAIII